MVDPRRVISSVYARGWETLVEKPKVTMYASRRGRPPKIHSLQDILLRDVIHRQWHPLGEVVMYDLQECEKGVGMFAIDDIQPHQCLVVEVPIVVDGNIEAQVEALDENNKSLFWQLHDCHASGGKTAVGIYRTNAFPLGPRGEGLFPLLSRVNHSCKPNAQIVWDEQRGATMLVTCQHIAKGEEIAHSFLPAIDWPRERRLEFLRRRFCFDCKCVACAASSQISDMSDKRRLLINCLDTQLRKVRDILKQNDRMVAQDLIKQGLDAASKQLLLLRVEGVELTSLRDVAFDAYKLCCVGGQMPSAIQWLEVYRRYCELTEGPQSIRARQAAFLSRNPGQGWSS